MSTSTAWGNAIHGSEKGSVSYVDNFIMVKSSLVAHSNPSCGTSHITTHIVITKVGMGPRMDVITILGWLLDIVLIYFLR